ncbi:MAG: hypothetical protein C0412_11190 [Flavobacterium sp.]|nr:hypothetical protein [Flavobacterium sp.]
MSDIKKLRRKIEKIDKKLLEVLAERFKITLLIGEYKKKYKLSAFNKEREKELFKKRKYLVEKLNLDVILVERIFKLIIKKVRQNHQKIKNEKNKSILKQKKRNYPQKKN